MDWINSKFQIPTRLLLAQELWEIMRSDVEERSPEEACGLVAGKEDRGLKVIPITNQLHSPTRFRFDPQEQIEAFNDIQNKGWELTAIYHSHPQGPASPSSTDIEQAYYPESISLIWSKTSRVWNCRGFVIQNGDVIEIPVIVST